MNITQIIDFIINFIEKYKFIFLILLILYIFSKINYNQSISEKISIGIPCIPKHIKHLDPLIKSINDQNLLPKEIIISLSESSKENGLQLENNLNKFSISPIKVISSSDKKYAGENRNICGKNCNTELISFIDSDDLMCPTRIQILEKVFNSENYDVLFHNYTDSFMKCSRNYNQINNKEITLNQYKENNITDEKVSVYLQNVAHGHLTIKKNILNQYPIDDKGWGEDTRYLHILFKNNLNVVSLPDYNGTIYQIENSSWN